MNATDRRAGRRRPTPLLIVLFAATLSAALIAAPARADDPAARPTVSPAPDASSTQGPIVSDDHADYDMDGDGDVTLLEFKAILDRDNRHLDLDRDFNGEVSAREYTRSHFERWDTDGNNRMNRDELEHMRAVWFEGERRASLRTWDRDGDHLVSGSELHTLIKPAYFAPLDANDDERLSESEFIEGLSAQLDRDGDGYLSEAELDAFDRTWPGQEKTIDVSHLELPDDPDDPDN